MVQQLLDVLRFFCVLSLDPEQVIEVPKILLEDVSLRTAVREPQLAEQLVEVPTIVSYSWLQLIVEQNDDIPVPGRGGRIAGLQGFLPGQSSTALHGSLERFSERIVEQNVDSPLVEGLQDFLPGQSSSSSSHVPALFFLNLWMRLVTGFFELFPKFKKARSWYRTWGRNCRAHPRRQLMWTLGSTATTFGSVSTPCKGHTGGSCCPATGSGTRRGKDSDSSTVAMYVLLGAALSGC